MARLRDKYREEVAPALKQHFGYKVNADGSKTRICKKCHEQID